MRDFNNYAMSHVTLSAFEILTILHYAYLHCFYPINIIYKIYFQSRKTCEIILLFEVIKFENEDFERRCNWKTWSMQHLNCIRLHKINKKLEIPQYDCKIFFTETYPRVRIFITFIAVDKDNTFY